MLSWQVGVHESIKPLRFSRAVWQRNVMETTVVSCGVHIRVTSCITQPVWTRGKKEFVMRGKPDLCDEDNSLNIWAELIARQNSVQ